MVSIDTEDLYALPRNQFVAERNKLAKELRGQGEKAAAEEMASLTKPSAAAWIVNQLARSRPKEVRALLAAGRKLRAAGGTAEMRAATEKEREATAALMRSAEAIAAGTPAATLERVRETLHAAAADEETGEVVRAGRLDKERLSIGLGPALAASTGSPQGKPRAGRAAEGEGATGRAAAEGKEAAAAAKEARAEQRRLEQAVRTEEKRLSAAREKLEKAAQRRETAEETEAEARRLVEETTERLEEAKRLRAEEK